MNRFQADICLLAVTLCWSCEVILHAVVPAEINPFATSCATSLIGAVVLWAYFARKIKNAFQQDRFLLLRRLLFLSMLSVAYNVLFIVGLEYFDVSTGAFAASMTVVILPVVMLIVRRNITVRSLVSAALVFVGVLIAVSHTLDHEMIGGHVVMTLGCLLRAVFIVKLNDYARQHDPVALGAGIAGFSAVISFVPWFAMQPGTFVALPWTPQLIAAYFIFGYFIVAFAGVLNVYAQRRASAVHSTIIYSTEIIFSILLALILPDSVIDPIAITPTLVTGCTLVVIGNIWETIPLKQLQDKLDRTIGKQDVEEDAAADTMSAARPHPLATLLDRLHTPTGRKVLLLAALLFVYLLIALPFRTMSLIPGFADVRPVYMLAPVYGIFFGMPGAIAFAVGNLIGDILSGSLRWSSIAGFVGNFAYAYLLNLFWTKLRKEPFSVRNGRTAVMLVASFVVCACVTTLIIAPAVAFYYPQVDILLFASSCLNNMILFPTAFAIPFIILIQEELGFTPLGGGNRANLGIEG